SRCNVARDVARSASAAFALDSASCALCSSSGLLNSNITSPGSTFVPGQILIFSTRPSVFAGIQRMSSGTSVPRPRTWRTIGPRFTVSIQTVERSTLGTAGFNREIATVAKIKPTADAAMIMMRRLRFFAATPLRGTSIEERLGENPAGRTILWSGVFRSGITVSFGSEQRQSTEKLDHCEHAGHDRHYCHDNKRAEHCGFGRKLAVRFGVEVIPADVAQRVGSLNARRARSIEHRRVVTTVDERELLHALSYICGWFHVFSFTS